MSRLFWKLFFALWLSIMAFAVIATWAHVTVARQDIPDPPEIAFARNVDKAERMLGTALRRGGPERVREVFGQLPWPVRNQVFLFSESGEEILGRQRIRRHLDRNDAQWRSRTLQDRAGQEWELVILRRAAPSWLLEPGSRGVLFRLLLASFISALVSWFLARSLARPLEALGDASRQLATGDLAARVGEPVVGRRDEFGALARNLDSMAARLETAQKAGNRLLRDVSHELRSPLARQRVALELARSRSGEVVAAELDRIELESERLETLVDEVLTLMRETSRSSPFRPEDFDLGELLSDLAEVVSYELPDSAPGIEQQFEKPLQVHADRELLWRAVENLLRNALLHSDPAQPITLSARPLDPEAVEIRVRDRGPGVPESQLESIFDPFSRSDEARDRASGGHGLGLAIAAAAVRRHHGSLRARNHPGGGLELLIRMPVARAQEASSSV